jgi:hypothetical protein
MNLCLVKFSLVEKQRCQGVGNPEQLFDPTERGCDPEGHLQIVDGLLCLARGPVNETEDMVTVAEIVLVAFLQEQIDRAGCGSLCGAELPVTIQHPSKVVQTLCLPRHVTESFVNLQRFFCLLHPFLLKA